MSFAFNPHGKVIRVRADLVGPAGRLRLRLALDTGASRTAISAALLLAAGHDPALSSTLMQVTTASGIATAPLVDVLELHALGHRRTNFPVIAHTLPGTANLEGLLGLDFFRGFELKLDFRNGLIDLH